MENEDIINFRTAAEILLGTFPEEIWIKIFNFVTDPKDFLNLGNASLYFRSLVRTHKQGIINDFVFSKLFHLHYFLFCVESCNFDIFFGNGYFKNCEGYNNILSLRQIYKKWSKILDTKHNALPQAFQNDSDKRKMEENAILWNITTPTDVGRWAMGYHVTFSDYDPDIIEDFLDHFELVRGRGQTRNPFPARLVIFKTCDHHLEAPNVVDVGRRYGRYIWYCHLEIEDDFPGGEAYTRLKLLMNLMPNLRTLEIIYKVVSNSPSTCTEKDLQIKHEIKLNDLPTLKNLWRVKTNGMPDYILGELIHQNSQANWRLLILQDSFVEPAN